MARKAVEKQKKVDSLPVLVVSPGDVNRLLRELETVAGALSERALRGKTSKAAAHKPSQLLDQIAELNGLDLLQKDDQKHLKVFLETVTQQAPVLHMSFSVDPSVNFLQKLMTWLRREIHPQLLLTIGLQPTIGAGCIIRSTNRYFDFSLRQDFANKRELLLKQLTVTRPPEKAKP